VPPTIAISSFSLALHPSSSHWASTGQSAKIGFYTLPAHLRAGAGAADENAQSDSDGGLGVLEKIVETGKKSKFGMCLKYVRSPRLDLVIASMYSYRASLSSSDRSAWFVRRPSRPTSFSSAIFHLRHPSPPTSFSSDVLLIRAKQSPDGRSLALSTESGQIMILDSESRQVVAAHTSHAMCVRTLSWSGDSQVSRRPVFAGVFFFGFFS
jgi:hypothetical protein